MSDTLAGATPRTHRWTGVIAHLLWLVVVIAYVLDVVFLYLNAPTSGEELGPLAWAVEDFPFVIIATLGLMVLRSQPLNQVGWWMMMAGLSFPLEGLASELVTYGTNNWGENWVVVLAIWVTGWVWMGGQLSIPFILLYYPDGRLPSRRWRPVAVLFWAVVVTVFVFFAFVPWTDDTLGVANPFGIEALAGMEGLIGVLGLMLPVLPLIGAVSLIFRYRSADTVVRQQVKFIGLLAFVSVVFFAESQLFGEGGPLLDIIMNVVFALFAAGTIGGAIMRYRLFDIDRLISRTISYTVVVAILGLVYFALVALVTTWLDFHSSLAVAVTTLTVAALFNPVRRRVQDWVDRRFNRPRYDAARVLDAFAERLRDEVDVERLGEDLTESVTQAMQPSFASVWVAER